MATTAKILRIYVGENMKWKNQSLYRALLYKIKDAGLAGATVIRGVEGFGQLRAIHTARLLELSADLPMVVECIDYSDKIDAIISEIKEMVPRGLIITSEVDVHNADQVWQSDLPLYNEDYVNHVQ